MESIQIRHQRRAVCDSEYDALYKQQLAETDRTKRIDIVKKMQQVLEDRASLVILGYDNPLEAYRADKWAPFVTQPSDGGVIMNQQGYWGYYSATPGKTTDEAARTGPLFRRTNFLIR